MQNWLLSFQLLPGVHRQKQTARTPSLLHEVGKQLRASDEKLSAARAAAEKAKSILAEERTTLLQARHSPTSCGAARLVFSRCSATKKTCSQRKFKNALRRKLLTKCFIPYESQFVLCVGSSRGGEESQRGGGNLSNMPASPSLIALHTREGRRPSRLILKSE